MSPVLVALGTDAQELIATPLRSRFACLEDCASARMAAAGSTACWRILGSRPAFRSCSSPTELEGTANCAGLGLAVVLGAGKGSRRPVEAGGCPRK